MARDTTNGALWTLGLLGAVAGVSALQGRRAASIGTARGGSFARLPHGSTCGCCGTKVGSLAKVQEGGREISATVYKARASKDDGLRYIKGAGGYEVYVKVGPADLTPLYQSPQPPGVELVPTLPAGKVKTWRLKPAHGSSLLRSRFDLRNAFLVPYEDAKSLQKEYKIFEKKAEQAFRRLTSVKAQDEVLDKLGDKLFQYHGIGAYNEDGALVEPVKARDYAREKAVLRTKKESEGRTLSSKEYAKIFAANERDYLIGIYIDRLWSIEILDRYDANTPRDRKAVFNRAKGENIFDDLDLSMVLPGRVSPSVFSGVSSPVGAEGGQVDEEEEKAQAEQVDKLDDLADAEKDVKGGPQIRMFKDGVRQSIFFIGTAGTQYFPYGLSRIAMLTATSKMSSPSFGLPAGAEKEGGTCPARLLSAPLKLDAEDRPGRREIICDRCYAMGANYGYANNMIAQQGRAKWVRQFTDEPKGAFAPSRQARVRDLANSLALMVASYAIYGSGSGRSEQEIGVWNADKEHIEYGVGSKKHKAEDTDLSIVLGAKVMRPVQIEAMKDRANLASRIANTRAWFEALGVEGGKVCGFFRLHDSGDFGVIGAGSAYLEAWGRVFKMLPHVQFWAPTRMWASMVTRARLESDPNWVAFDKRFMNEFIPGRTSQALRKTYRLRKRSGSRGVASTIKKQQPEAAPSLVSPGEAGLQLADLDEMLDRNIVPNNFLIKGFRQISANTPNIALRPSNLYVTTFAPLPKGASVQQLVSSGMSANIPTFDGLSAGTGVVKAYRKGVYPKVYDTRGVEAYACPVYTKDESGKEAKSCRDARCRACWLAQELPIFYGAH